MKKNFHRASLMAALGFLCLSIINPPDASGGKVYVPKGTEITIKFKLDLSTEIKTKPSPDDIFEIAASQKITGIDVLTEGGRVFCEITEFRKPGALGRGGAIEIRIDSVSTALGKNIRVESKLLANHGKSNKTKALLLLPALGYGFLIKGAHAELGRENDTVILKTSDLGAISY